jgi:hypothetical protein
LESIAFTTTTSISALGALTTWNASQVLLVKLKKLILILLLINFFKLASTVLGVPITKYITTYLGGTISSSFLSAAGNLLCSLTQTQINSIATSVFT